MITIVFLKALCDLGLYFTFAGLLAVLLGASPTLLLAALPIQAACFATSFPLRRSPLRFLPLALMAGCWLLPGAGLSEYVAFAPPAVYLVWLAAKGHYFPEWSHQADIFSRFWKIFFLFLILASLFGRAEAAASITIPAGTATLLCSVLLTRSLRHDPEVYCQPRCQLLNLAAVAGAGFCAFLLSTPAFLQACLAVLRSVYMYLVNPILMLAVYAMVGIVAALIWLFSWIQLGFQPPEESVMMDLQGIAETLEIETAGNAPGYLEKIGIALAAIAGFLLWALFRYLARRNAVSPPLRERSERREAIAAAPTMVGGRKEHTHVQQVRAQYRHFLKLYLRAGYPRSPCDTSQDIARYSRETMGNDVSTLREIYIAARYDGVATREDAARAREICTRLKQQQQK